jgi:integrase
MQPRKGRLLQNPDATGSETNVDKTSRKKKPMRGKRGVYKRGDVWLAVVEGFADPKTGKRKRIWLQEGLRTRKAAEEARDQMREQLRGGIGVVPKKITVVAYLTRWLAYIESRVSPRTAKGYRGIVIGRLIPTLGATELSRLTALQVSAAITLWATEKRHDRRAGTVSAQTIKHAVTVLREALSQAVKWNLVARNVAALVDSPRVSRKEQPFVCADDLDRLFVEADKCRDGMFAAVATAVGLGVRRGELLGLQWADVDFERKTVAVERSLERIDGKLTTKPPKTKLSRRTVRMPSFVLDALRAHGAAQAKHRLKHGLGKVGPTGWVFANALGEALDLDAFGKRFQRLTVRAGLPHVHLHSLRHGYAVLGLQAGIDLKTVSSNLGHSSIRLTADTYSHVIASVGEDAAERMDGVLRGRGRAAK